MSSSPSILILVLLISMILASGSHAFLTISETKGTINLVDKKYDVIINNVTVASIKIRPSVYNYYIVERDNVLIVFLHSAPLNFSIKDIYVKEIGEGSGEYAISMDIKINRSCPNIVRGWIKSSSGPPLVPILEELGTSGCIIRIETLGIPLSTNSWASVSLEWNSSQALMLFGPIKAHALSPSLSNTVKQTLPRSLVSIAKGGLRTESPMREKAERAVTLFAIGLSVFASIASLVYEVGISRKS